MRRNDACCNLHAQGNLIHFLIYMDAFVQRNRLDDHVRIDHLLGLAHLAGKR